MKASNEPSDSAGTEVPAGTWLANPVTGERALVVVGPAETNGRRIEAELLLRPDAAVAGPHVHEHLIERFEVLEGSVGFLLDGSERSLQPGEGVTEIPAGTVHDWWNAGTAVARVRVEVEAAANSPGQPAARFVSMIEAMWSLGTLGRVNRKGMPDPLWLGAIAREYRDVIRFTRPPAWVQAAMFGPLAAIARHTGRDPMATELHGLAAACVIPTPPGEGSVPALQRAAGSV